MIPTNTENGAAKKESSFIVTGQEEPENVFDIRIPFRKLPFVQSAPFGSGEMPINFASFIMNHCVRWKTTWHQQLKLVLCILQEWWENTWGSLGGRGDAARNSWKVKVGGGSLCEVLDFFSWERVGHYFSKTAFPSCKLISFTPNFPPATPAPVKTSPELKPSFPWRALPERWLAVAVTRTSKFWWSPLIQAHSRRTHSLCGWKETWRRERKHGLKPPEIGRRTSGRRLLQGIFFLN